MTSGADPGGNRAWDNDLFRLYGWGVTSESWQDGYAANASDFGSQDFGQDFGPEDFPAQEFGGHEFPAQDFGGQKAGYPAGHGTDPAQDYGRGLFGGPGADLFGSRVPPESPPDPGPNSISMPSISQPMSPISQSMPAISQPMSKVPEADGQDPGETGSLVRPYARTRGRTRTDYDLAIETLVSTSERGRSSDAAVPEHRSICGLCVDARSVAEIAAHMRLPLGVVRVLIGDMAGLGLVLIHESGMVVGDQPSLEFLERVLSGLRRL